MNCLRRSFAARVAVPLLALAGAACSPTLDWREFVPEDSGLHVSFPCRPDRQARDVPLEGGAVRMEMLVCEAGGATWAVSFLGLADPARVTPMLAAWRAAAVAHVQGRAEPPVPVQVRGMTPNAQALRVSIAGQLPDGAAVQEHAAFFAHGLRLYSASVISKTALKPEAMAVFFEALGFPA